jgi:uncharacterized protein (TIGR03643 family)
MGISRDLKQKITQLSIIEQDRLVRMGWEDRTTFEAIQAQFNISPNEFVKFMRTQLEAKAFARWRRRVFEQGHLKNQKTRGFVETRFKCSRQSVDGIIKGNK